MLKDIGAQYIIIGHSERRTYHKESDELIAKKFAVLKEQGLTPVLCIGETRFCASVKPKRKTKRAKLKKFVHVRSTRY